MSLSEELAQLSVPLTEADAIALVVDLDGTLLRSDMLHESFWSSFSNDWQAPFGSLKAMRSGRAALKRQLARTSRIDAATLPYDQDVISYIRAWRNRGGRVALVTASDQSFAEGVADHLKLFDDVRGSDGITNLKGREKADFLVSQYGEGGYAYAGDSAADLPVWEKAARIITVNAGPELKARTERLDKPVEHLGTARASWRAHLVALRPHQWLKNLLVFLPMLAAHRFEMAVVLQSLAAFVAFSLVASSVYLLNDLLDLQMDRAHPRKRHRALASGALPISHASIMIPALLTGGFLVAVALGWRFAAVLAVYFLVTLAYSLVLKRKEIIDVCVLAGLYTLRVIAGAAATGMGLSVWIAAFCLFLFMSLAAVKRQAELVDLAKRKELSAVGRGYHVGDLPIVSMVAITSGFVSVLVLALYINSPAVLLLYAHPTLLWGVACILLYWTMHMVMVAHRGAMTDDPIVFAASDRTSQICLVLAAVIVAASAGIGPV